MELRAFTEQVLFATSLEEKLWRPEVVTDEQPGPAITAPSSPGRPPELHFKAERGGNADFPRLHQIEREAERGRLLHFFANHELLATELMALVLLRFPDAPPAFRRGVLQTLYDEQDHTRLYVERMAACGVGFGELPVSGYFWRVVSGMENPIDYVAGLSLTFEQANLDFSRHYAACFSAVGDAPTAGLLDRIYHDEIRHVAYGLRWFRRWKQPDESDWAAFCRVLRFPLSPQRAKGFAVNVEGRRLAGLDAAFIAELEVYAQSRGRTPGVFLFNPFAEGHLAQGRAFTPDQRQRELQTDLGNLPQFLCRQDDLVLVERRPSVTFLAGLKRAGFVLPEFVALGETIRAPWRERADGPPVPADALAERKFGALRPWAWGPDSVALLRPFAAHSALGEADLEARCGPAIAALYSKASGAALLSEVLARCPGCPGEDAPVIDAPGSWLCDRQDVGREVRSLEAALAVIAEGRGRGPARLVAKEALGLAGSNAIRLWEPELLESQRRWMAGVLERGQSLIIEPWRDRLLDFSLQYEMGPDGLRRRGCTGLINDHRGQFQGNHAAPNHARSLPETVAQALPAHPARFAWLQRVFDEVAVALEARLRAAGYAGPVGIDAFVFRDAQGVPRLKPVVEINPRYTMGRLTLELMRQVAPGSHGLLLLWNRALLRRIGRADFSSLAAWLAEAAPVEQVGEPKARIRAGAICLNDAATARVSLAVFHVFAEAQGVAAFLASLGLASAGEATTMRASRDR
ncbi:MAG: DUF455 family protein [Verrucomicrobiales bacterium]|nr:DUF455 family protein [Verrucomicrobiales bacterium]